MSEQAPQSSESEHRHQLPHFKLPRFRWILLGAIGVVLLLWVLPSLLNAISDLDIEIKHPYGWIAFFVTFDAVIPILPSESLLHLAAVKANAGELELWTLILAAGIGAVVGDSILYWISRTVAHNYFSHKIDAAKKNDKVKIALGVFGESGPLLIILGRYVPGVRFVVNATMGITKYPYDRFLFFSVIGGFTWSAYTLLISFYVGELLGDYPILSFVTGIAFTSAIMALLFFPLKHRYQQQQQQADDDANVAPDPQTGDAAS